jgi:hypothetical protein
MFERIWRTFLRIGASWCSVMHDSARWPIHAHCHCGTCGRRRRVQRGETESAVAGRVREPLPATVSFAILPALLLTVVLASPVRGAERTAPDDSAAATAVLRRFIASQPKAGLWTVETVEIKASLPRLKKIGRLRAIRRLLPLGAPDYTVLEIGGDPTVLRQVISRYIASDERATGLPASSVAVTPANYKIHYVGTVSRGNDLAYSFRLIPLRKREGLINGVLWLDGQTALAVREFGYLAKSPSVFVKRISVTRENDVDNGKVVARTTHVSVETRLIGSAQLVIIERPIAEELAAGGVTGDER